jgi:hypothetical protein
MIYAESELIFSVSYITLTCECKSHACVPTQSNLQANAKLVKHCKIAPTIKHKLHGARSSPQVRIHSAKNWYLMTFYIQGVFFSLSKQKIGQYCHNLSAHATVVFKCSDSVKTLHENFWSIHKTHIICRMQYIECWGFKRQFPGAHPFESIPLFQHSHFNKESKTPEIIF